jgi:hypothetical protein
MENTMKTNEILETQTQINELSRAMYKTWSRTGETLKANEAHLKSLCNKLDRLIVEAHQADKEAQKRRRLGV